MIDTFDEIKKIHFVGIGGIGMSALARMLKHQGKQVSGSDMNRSDITDVLEKEGIPFNVGQDKESLEDADIYIHTAALFTYAPEYLEYIKSLGKPVFTYPEALGIISKKFKTIAITGTHGKTSTTSMLGHVLTEAGLSPHVIVGSLMPNGSNYIPGDSDLLVIEAGEYRKAFLNYFPHVLAILNIEEDHLDYYETLDNIEAAFKEFVGQVDPEGLIICDKEEPIIERVVKDAAASVEQVTKLTRPVDLQVPGDHMIFDARVVIHIAKYLGVSDEDAHKYVETFSGAWRRSEYKGKHKSGAIVYDDYGHHPTEIETTLRGFRKKFSNKNLIVAYEPHLFSRTKQLFDGFVKAFCDADEILFAPIYKAREEDDGSISSKILADAVQTECPDKKITSYSSFEEIENYLEESLTEDDLLITMGAGDIYLIHKKLFS